MLDSKQRARLRRHPAARSTIAAWRGMTDGEGAMLVACSGGADSSALAIALAAAGADLTLAHVLHHQRSREEGLEDRAAVASLAEFLGVRMASAEAETSATTEGAMRASRYDALLRMAEQHDSRWVLTGHQLDDQLETVLMALARGAALGGLGGMPAARLLGGGVTLLRPCLGVDHASLCSLCEAAGWQWREDPTNAESLTPRNAIRSTVTPALAEWFPLIRAHAGRTAELVREASQCVERTAHAAFDRALLDDDRFDRTALRTEPRIVIAQGLRDLVLARTGGTGADKLSAGVLDPAAAAIIDHTTDPRVFEWPGGVRITVLANEVSLAFNQP